MAVEEGEEEKIYKVTCRAEVAREKIYSREREGACSTNVCGKNKNAKPPPVKCTSPSQPPITVGTPKGVWGKVCGKIPPSLSCHSPNVTSSSLHSPSIEEGEMSSSAPPPPCLGE